MSIVLITSDYFCKDIKRRREIRQVFNCNVKLSFVKKYIVAFEGFDDLSPSDKAEYAYLNHEKVEIVNFAGRQNYADLFGLAKQQSTESICVVANSDMIFDSTLNRLHEFNFTDKNLFALSRWEPEQNDESIFSTPKNIRHDMTWSYDSYIFKPQLEVDLATIRDIKIGLGGCDNLLVKRLIVDNLIRVENPVFDIRSYHADFRQTQNLTKDYFNQANYNTEYDYPGAAHPVFKTIQPFGGQIGLSCSNLDSRLVSSNRIYVKKGLKVISFSLWGKDDKYLKGAAVNAELALDIYPEWMCWFYIHRDVPQWVFDELNNYPNVKIFKMDNLNWPMSWRFTAIDSESVEVMIVRDTDSQLSMRERSAVDAWLASGKNLHVMRDHPHHGDKRGHRILGGMWGMKRVVYLPKMQQLINRFMWLSQSWGADQTLLQTFIYPLFLKYNDICCHASFFSNRFESFATDFPTPREADLKFVGEYNNWKGDRCQEHIDLIRSASNQPGTQNNRMKLSCCLVSCNANDFYLDFFPIVHAMWQDVVKIKCKLILVAEAIPEKLLSYKDDIILFKPIVGMSDVFQAQMLRMLYAAVMTEETGVIVSDMDLVPMSKRYYEMCNRFDEDIFVVYRDCLIGDQQFPICFNAASPKVWKEIFPVSNEAEIRNLLRLVYPRDYKSEVGNKFWFKDQLILFSSVTEWSQKSGSRLVILDDDYTNFRRLDRLDWNSIASNAGEIKKEIAQQKYTDFHMPRPFSQYKAELINLLDPLLTQASVEVINSYQM